MTGITHDRRKEAPLTQWRQQEQLDQLQLLIYTLIFGLAIAGGVMYLSRVATDNIALVDLQKLIESTEVDEDGERKAGELTVTNGERKIKYSDLREVRVGPFLVTGKVHREVISPKDPNHSPNPSAKFRTDKSMNDEAGKQLTDSLSAKGIDWKHVPAPSIWSSYAPMLLVSALFILAVPHNDATVGWSRFANGVR